MQNWLKGALIAAVSVAGTLVISQVVRGPVEGRAPDVNVLRTADGKPDLNGIWQAIGSAHWNLLDHQARSGPVLELGAIVAVPAGLSVVEGNEIPYQPWAAARQKENYENWLSRDPEVKCYLPLTRATYMPIRSMMHTTTRHPQVEYSAPVGHQVAKGAPPSHLWAITVTGRATRSCRRPGQRQTLFVARAFSQRGFTRERSAGQSHLLAYQVTTRCQSV